MTNRSPKRERFCLEYMADLNATQAAIRAGYATNSARSQARELLTNPNIERRIAELEAERAARTEIAAEEVVRELAKMGFASVARFLDLSDPEAPCLTLEHADEDDLAAIAEINARGSRAPLAHEREHGGRSFQPATRG